MDKEPKEKLPVFDKIQVGEEEHEMTRANTSLYKHLGHYAVFDHIFVVTSDSSGAYIWNDNQLYPRYTKGVVDNQCTMHLNIQKASEMDVNNFMRHHSGDLEELKTVPEDWE